MTEPQPMMVCLRRDVAPAPPTSASTPVTCEECGASCWLSPDGAVVVERERARLVCTACVAHLVGDDYEFVIHREQRPHLERLGILKGAEGIVRSLNREQRHRKARHN